MGAPPLRIFRRALYLRLTTGTMAEDLVPDAAATVLKGTFRPFDYDALTVTEPSLRATLTAKGDAVVVGLDAPRRVFQVVIATAKVPTAGYSLEVYRLDGEAMAEAPTVTAINAVIALDVLLEVEGAVGSSTRRSRRAVIGGGNPDVVLERIGSRPFDLDFTDARFALRLKGPAGPVALAPGDLVAVRIRSYPSGPRLGLAVPEDPTAPATGDPAAAVVFWRAPGEVGTTTPADQGNVDAGGVLAQELGRGVRRLGDGLRDAAPAEAPPPVLPPSLDVALVIESDAPCLLETTAFGVSYHLARRSFPAGEPKQVLRFAGGGDAVRAIPILLPAAATVRSASLKTVASFRGDRLAAGGDEAAPDGVPAGRTGILVGGTRSVAQAVSLPEALRLSGLAVVVSSLARGTELRAEVREDDRGGPTGRTLAAGILAPGPMGRSGWVTLRLADPVVLTTAPLWLVLTAAVGQAVWLARDGTAAVRVGDSSDPGTTWTEPAGIAGLETVYRFLSPVGPGGAPSPVTVRLGETVLIGTSDADDADTRTYVLTAALNAALAGPATTASREVPLTVSAVIPGLLTVYPPEVEFDLPP